MAKQEAQKVKKQNAIVRYFREVRAEVRKVVWPSWQTARNLSLIVFGVTAVMSGLLGVADWIFTKVFALFIQG